MKVLDLCCGNGHTFEGWFASEIDFVEQCEKSHVQCPVCSNSTITKKLSAPRLNLSGQGDAQADGNSAAAPSTVQPAKPSALQSAVEAWAAISREVLANTEDVGANFAEEARRIHYGESQSRAIRGQTTVEEAKDLVEEGVNIMPLMLPDALKNPLH